MKHNGHVATIDVYPVGLWDDVRQFRGRWRHDPAGKRAALRRLRWDLRYPLMRIRCGNWRALKNYFNGYLAEPTPFPDNLRRCGSGWTRERAVRSLERLQYEAAFRGASDG